MEGGYPGDILTQNQRVHAGGSLQRTDGLQVAKMTDNVMIGQNTACPGDIPGHARYFYGLANIV